MEPVFTGILSETDVKGIVFLLEKRVTEHVEEYLKNLLSNPDWFAFMVDKTEGTPAGVLDQVEDRQRYFWSHAETVRADKRKMTELVEKVSAALVVHIMGELASKMQSHMLARAVNEMVLSYVRNVATGREGKQDLGAGRTD